LSENITYECVVCGGVGGVEALQIRHELGGSDGLFSTLA